MAVHGINYTTAGNFESEDVKQTLGDLIFPEKEADWSWGLRHVIVVTATKPTRLLTTPDDNPPP